MAAKLTRREVAARVSALARSPACPPPLLRGPAPPPPPPPQVRRARVLPAADAQDARVVDLACASIGSQVLHEASSPGRSSLSWLFVLGFALIYSFWFLYGLRFRRLAIWLPNAIAVVLQILLAAAVALKARAS